MAKWKRYYKKDIVITDPYFILKKLDWRRCIAHEDINDGLRHIGFKDFTCYDITDKNWQNYINIEWRYENGRLVNFSQGYYIKSGFVVIFALNEIKSYISDFLYNDTKPGAGFPKEMPVVIKNFTGGISFEEMEYGYVTIRNEILNKNPVIKLTSYIGDD